MTETKENWPNRPTYILKAAIKQRFRTSKCYTDVNNIFIINIQGFYLPAAGRLHISWGSLLRPPRLDSPGKNRRIYFSPRCKCPSYIGTDCRGSPWGIQARLLWQGNQRTGRHSAILLEYSRRCYTGETNNNH